jgi:hypothetical protein
VVKLIGKWLLTPSPSGSSKAKASARRTLSTKERASLMAKLSRLERLSGFPEARSLMGTYRDVVYKVMALREQKSASGHSIPGWVSQPVVLGSFAAGLLADSVAQRRKFFGAFARHHITGKGPYSRLRFIAPMSSSMWIPAAISVLTSAIHKTSGPVRVGESVAVVRAARWVAQTTAHHRILPSSASLVNSQGGGGGGDDNTGVLPMDVDASPSTAATNAATTKSVAPTSLTTVISSGGTMDDGQSSAAQARQALMEADANFVQELTSLKRPQPLLYALQELAYGDGSGRLGATLWSELFRHAWAVLEEQQQMTMTQGLHVLLARGYHLSHSCVQSEIIARMSSTTRQLTDGLQSAAVAAAAKSHGRWDPYGSEGMVMAGGTRMRRWARQFKWSRVNVVQVLLQGMERCRPLPLIAPELLQFVGCNYGSWFHVVKLGELLLVESVDDAVTAAAAAAAAEVTAAATSVDSGLTSKGKRKRKKKTNSVTAALASSPSDTLAKHADRAMRWVPVLQSMYEALGMRESERGLAQSLVVTPASQAALAYEAVGMWRQAQKLYESAMVCAQNGDGRYAVQVTDTNDGPLPSPFASERLLAGAHIGANVSTGADKDGDHSMIPLAPHDDDDPAAAAAASSSSVDMSMMTMPLDDGFMVGLDDFSLGIDGGLFDDFNLDLTEPLLENQHDLHIGGTPASGGGGTGGSGTGTLKGNTHDSKTQTQQQQQQSKAHKKYVDLDVPEQELSLWSSRWVHCAKELSQWEEVADLGRERADAVMFLDGASMSPSPDIKRLSQLCRTKGVEAAVQDRDMEVILQKLYLAVQSEQPIAELETMWREAVDVTLHAWQGRNVVATDSSSWSSSCSYDRTDLMVGFQRLVELGESIRVLRDLPADVARCVTALSSAAGSVAAALASSISGKSSATPGGNGSAAAAAARAAAAAAAQPVGLVSLISRWRNRMPDDFEDMLAWSRVMQWRINFFDIAEHAISGVLTKKLTGAGRSSLLSIVGGEGETTSSNEAITAQLMASASDKDRSLLFAAAAARLHNGSELCLEWLARMQDMGCGAGAGSDVPGDGTPQASRMGNLMFMKLHEEMQLGHHVRHSFTMKGCQRPEAVTRPQAKVMLDLENLVSRRGYM